MVNAKSPNQSETLSKRRRGAHLFAAVICLLACAWGINSAARAGASRLLANYGFITAQLAATDLAVQFSPTDARAHYIRAYLLLNDGEFAASVKEFERAAAVRPDHYVLWLDLGRARERAGDTEGARLALAEAVRLAPFYAQPRWQLGNILLRSGRREEAFAELRRAAESNPTLFPATVSLAWGMYGGDARSVAQAVQPQTVAARLELARFFASHDRAREAVEIFRAAGESVSAQDRRALLTDLITAKRFPEAYEIWASEGNANDGARSSNGVAHITDGGFESDINLEGVGFGWLVAPDVKTARVSLDVNQPYAGQRSARVEFNGNSTPSTPVVSQLVLVDANARYRLSFSARTEEIVTGGLPFVSVTDADNGNVLAQSQPLSRNTNGWQSDAVDFSAAEKTRAVRISLQRQSCDASPCPIFGRIWLDAFSLARRL